MRLFVAIPIPKAVKQKLSDLQQPIEGMRWQAKEQMHITLKFVGEADTGLTEVLQKQLDDIEQPDFTIDIQGVGYFPERKQPKVLWVGIKENASLLELQQKVENKCREVGIAANDRPYKPHITLARTKSTSKRTVNAFINENKKFAIRDILISEFVLYESKLHSDGAHHSRLKTFSLNENK